MAAFESGRVIDRHFENLQALITYRGIKLHAAEKSLLKFLKRESLNRKAKLKF